MSACPWWFTSRSRTSTARSMCTIARARRPYLAARFGASGAGPRRVSAGMSPGGADVPDRTLLSGRALTHREHAGPGVLWRRPTLIDVSVIRRGLLGAVTDLVARDAGR